MSIDGLAPYITSLETVKPRLSQEQGEDLGL